MYDTYRITKTKEQYYKHWKQSDLALLSEDRQNEIYQKYFIKSAVFQRDNFTCRNEECKAPESKLTLHHTKFVKNNGKWSLKNCITICKSCHRHYHKGKGTLTYDGMTYQIHKETEMNWKQVRAMSKVIRKENKSQHGVRISWELMAMLMKFMFDKEIEIECELEDEVEDEDTVDDDK